MDLLNASARLWARLAELTKHLFQIVARSVGPALRAALKSRACATPCWRCQGALTLPSVAFRFR